MKSITLRALFLSIIVSTLWFGAANNARLFAQARRQPPSSDQKKNKRPGDQQTGEKPEEPLPADITNKPQEAEKVTVSTNVVNVDAVV